LNFSTGKPVHHGIQVAKVNPETGKVSGEVIDLWEGAGLMFPEGPHLYKVGEYWYLLAAEGGTDRGHAVTVARSHNILGPWESAPNNPVLTARSEFHSVQNVGHADLVETPDGGWAMVALGVRSFGTSNGFSPLGRETFISAVTWVDGWPVCERIEVNEVQAPKHYLADFRSLETEGVPLEWIGMRRYPEELAVFSSSGLTLPASGRTMSHLEPDALCRRQTFLSGRAQLSLTTNGVAGLSIRYNEAFHYDIEAQPGRVVARFAVNTVVHEIASEVDFPDANQVDLYIDFKERPGGFSIGGNAPDYIELGYLTKDGEPVALATWDGRFLSQEVNSSFTGRAFAIYSVEGDSTFLSYKEFPKAAKASSMENNFSESI
jgi:beta-xylosidase